MNTVFNEDLEKRVSNEKFSTIYFGHHFERGLCFLVFDKVLMFVLDPSSFTIDKTQILERKGHIVKIVGKEDEILSLDNNGNLYQLGAYYEKLSNLNTYLYWQQFTKLNFRTVLGITAFDQGFACLEKDGNGRKTLKVFDVGDYPDVHDYTFDDLNLTESDDYYLSTVDKSDSTESLIISDRVSGKTYLCLNKTESFLLHFSNIQVISAISVPSEECFIVCFENGKLCLYFFSDLSSNCTLFLHKRLVCIEKCHCNDKCIIWSDGVNLNHSEIFFGDQIQITHYVFKYNITGVLSLTRFFNYTIAVTLNNICYRINCNECEKQAIVQRPGEILSQIFKESLKINEFQKNLEVASEYMNCKAMIQTHPVNMKINWDGNFLSIQNMTEITFKKEFWKIKLKMHTKECESVKLIDLETDLVNKMMVKIQDPFTINGRVKVYLIGKFEWELLWVYVGIVGEEDNLRKNLKKRLNDMLLQKNNL